MVLLLAWPLAAGSIRVASYNVSLGRDGPGLLLKAIEQGKDQQIETVVRIIARVAPDILMLGDFDYDRGNMALAAFADRLAVAGIDYPYRFALAPNSGYDSGADLNGDGYLHDPADAFGFGKFPGAQGMAILSRYPPDLAGVKDFSGLLWADLPGASLPMLNGRPFLSEPALKVHRLSSKGHWDVPILLPDGEILRLYASHPTPPVFDGAENLNGLRNRDEIRFWLLYLGGLAGDERFVIVGDLNADPFDGAGAHDSIRALLAHPLVQDAKPASQGAAIAAKAQGGPNQKHQGAAELDTVDWDEARTPGNMRVDYVLPSANMGVTGAGVFWPAPDQSGYALVGPDGSTGSHHRLVWVDLVTDR